MCRLQREQPDRTRAEHRHRIAGPDARVLRAHVAGGEDVAEEEHVLVRQARGHPLAHVIGERHPDRLRLPARILLPEAAPEDRAAGGDALGGQAHAAPLAEPARDRERRDDPVALPELAHRRARLLDHAHELVPHHHPGVEPGDPPVILVQVGAADRAGGDAQHHVGGIHDARVRHRLHPYVAWSVERDRLHALVLRRSVS